MKSKALFVLLAATAMTTAQAVTFSDGVFLDSQWAMSVVPGSLVGQMTEQILSGGNPGEYKRVATINNNFTYNFHKRAAFVYDPSVSGAISTIDWGMDYKNFNTFGQGQGFALALMQGGTIYRHLGYFTTDDQYLGWQSVSQSGFGSSAFGNDFSGFSTPNFTASGSAITFGFMTSNGFADTVDVGYDNYRVTINAVPEPATLSVLGIGLLALRRKRAKA
jgi:hypothetical protein